MFGVDLGHLGHVVFAADKKRHPLVQFLGLDVQDVLLPVRGRPARLTAYEGQGRGLT